MFALLEISNKPRDGMGTAFVLDIISLRHDATFTLMSIIHLLLEAISSVPVSLMAKVPPDSA